MFPYFMWCRETLCISILFSLQPYHLFIDRSPWADGDELYLFRGHAINDSEFADPEASISFQFPLKGFSFLGLAAKQVKRVVDPFL